MQADESPRSTKQSVQTTSWLLGLPILVSFVLGVFLGSEGLVSLSVVLSGVFRLLRGAGINVGQWRESDRDSPSLTAQLNEPGNPADVFWGIVLIVVAIAFALSGMQLSEINGYLNSSE